MKEIIFGDRDQYKANEMGEVFSRTVRGSHIGTLSDNWRKLKPTPLKGGYLYLTINGRNGQRKYVHRIIAEIFLGEMAGMDVNHKNCNKQDNRLDNLEWVTRKENIHHARENGLLKPPRGLTMEQVRLIRNLLAENVRPIDIHRATGIPAHSIYSINEGKLYKRDF